MSNMTKRAWSKIFGDTYDPIVNPDAVYDSRLMHIIEGGDDKKLNEISTLINNIMRMVQQEIPLEQVWRVEMKGSGRVILNDFTMPSASSKIKKVIKLTDAPKFIRDAVSVLQIAPNGTSVDGVGKKIDEDIYYIVERNDGEHTREEGERCS
jgi:hypothetical protein